MTEVSKKIPLVALNSMILGMKRGADGKRDVKAIIARLKAMPDFQIDLSKFAGEQEAIEDDGPPLIFDLLNNDKPDTENRNK